MIAGITFGSFDLLHPGHIFMLNEARSMCDYLIVGLHTDPTIDRPKSKNKPVQTSFERFIQLDALRCVDSIIPYDTERDLENILLTTNVQKRFVGSDYSNNKNQITGIGTCLSRNIEIIFLDRNHDYSTTELRNRCIKQSF